MNTEFFPAQIYNKKIELHAYIPILEILLNEC